MLIQQECAVAHEFLLHLRVVSRVLPLSGFARDLLPLFDRLARFILRIRGLHVRDRTELVADAFDERHHPQLTVLVLNLLPLSLPTWIKAIAQVNILLADLLLLAEEQE